MNNVRNINLFSDYFILFRFVTLNTKETNEIQQKYKVHPNSDSLLIFHENINIPVVQKSMDNIQMDEINNIISKNQYLILPRLSSQEILDSKYKYKNDFMINI